MAFLAAFAVIGALMALSALTKGVNDVVDYQTWAAARRSRARTQKLEASVEAAEPNVIQSVERTKGLGRLLLTAVALGAGLIYVGKTFG